MCTQRLLEQDPPKTGRLMAYRMMTVQAGVEDVVDVPECSDASGWTMLEDVYPTFLYDDAEWAKATQIMPSLAENESLSAREVEEALSELGSSNGDRICPSFKTQMECASLLHLRATGASVEMIQQLPKGAPRLTVSLSLARIGEVSSAAAGPFSGFTAPALGGGDRAYDPNASDAYNSAAEPGVAPPKIWLLGKVGAPELAASLAAKLGLVDVSVASALEYCIAQGIETGVELPSTDATELPEEELALIKSVFDSEGLAKDEDTGACAATDLPAAVEATGPNPNAWLLTLAQSLAAKSTEEDPINVTLDDVAEARKAELTAAAGAAFKASLSGASPEVATKALVARLASAEVTHRGYVVGDAVAVDRIAVRPAAAALSRLPVLLLSTCASPLPKRFGRNRLTHLCCCCFVRLQADPDMKPTVVLTMSMSNEDVSVRKSEQRFDPAEEKLYEKPELDEIKALVAELAAAKAAADTEAAAKAAALEARKATFMVRHATRFRSALNAFACVALRARSVWRLAVSDFLSGRSISACDRRRRRLPPLPRIRKPNSTPRKPRASGPLCSRRRPRQRPRPPPPPRRRQHPKRAAKRVATRPPRPPPRLTSRRCRRCWRGSSSARRTALSASRSASPSTAPRPRPAAPSSTAARLSPSTAWRTRTRSWPRPSTTSASPRPSPSLSRRRSICRRSLRPRRPTRP